MASKTDNTKKAYIDAEMKRQDMVGQAATEIFASENPYSEDALTDLEDVLRKVADLFRVPPPEPFAATGMVPADAASLVMTVNRSLERAGLDDLDLDEIRGDGDIMAIAAEIDEALRNRKFVRWVKAEATTGTPEPPVTQKPEPVVESPMSDTDIMSALRTMRR